MKISGLVVFLFAITEPTLAELPFLDNAPWRGSFLAFKDRDARFVVSSKGNAMFEPLKRDGSKIATTNPINVNFDIYETLPNGKIVRKKIDENAFTSESPATLDPDKPVIIQGIVTGDAKFEITIGGGRGTVELSGRIVDKGSLTNPLHLAISIDFKPYKTKTIENDGQMKAFEKRVRRDRIKLELADRRSETLHFLEEIKQANRAADGFSAAEIRTQGYGEMRWNLTASQNSLLRFEDTRLQPLWNGFTIVWEPKKGADPAREKFVIKHN